MFSAERVTTELVVVRGFMILAPKKQDFQNKVCLHLTLFKKKTKVRTTRHQPGQPGQRFIFDHVGLGRLMEAEKD